MEGQKTLNRGLASGLVLVAASAIVAWVWPDDGSWFQSGVAIVSAAVSLLVVIALWKK